MSSLYPIHAAFGANDVLTLALILLLFLSPLAYSHIMRRWRDYRARQADLADALLTDHLRAATQTTTPRPPGKLVITSSVISVYLIALLIIASISFRASFTITPTLEALMLTVIVVWVSIPLARSSRDLVLKVMFFAAPLFAILFLLVYQTTTAFWITAAVLATIVIRELGQRFDTEPPLTKIAQTVIIFGFFTSALLAITISFLPALADTLYSQFDYLTLFRLRWIIGTFFAVIVTLATIIKIAETYRFQYRPLLAAPRPYTNPTNSLFRSLLYPFVITGQFLAAAIAYIINLAANFIRLVGTFFATLLIEGWRFVWHAFLSRPLWQTMFYIAMTAACLFILAATVLFVRPHLTVVLTTPTLLLDLNNTSLAWANLYLGLAFLATTSSIVALAQIWLPRPTLPETRQTANSRIIITAGIIYICSVAATFTYFPVLNFIFDLHSSDLNVPGVYTTLAAALAAIFTIFHPRPPPPPLNLSLFMI